MAGAMWCDGERKVINRRRVGAEEGLEYREVCQTVDKSDGEVT